MGWGGVGGNSVGVRIGMGWGDTDGKKGGGGGEGGLGWVESLFYFMCTVVWKMHARKIEACVSGDGGKEKGSETSLK